MVAGILEKIAQMTLFLNSTEQSYKRLGQMKAPKYISWSKENRSQLVRIPAAADEYKRVELRSADPQSNPYIAFTLMIRACLLGIENKLPLPAPVNLNLFSTEKLKAPGLEKLPDSLQAAKEIAKKDDWLKNNLPARILEIYCK